MGNRATQRVLSDLMVPLRKMFASEGGVILRVTPDFLYINDVRLRHGLAQLRSDHVHPRGAARPGRRNRRAPSRRHPRRDRSFPQTVLRGDGGRRRVRNAREASRVGAHHSHQIVAVGRARDDTSGTTRRRKETSGRNPIRFSSGASCSSARCSAGSNRSA